MPFEDIVAKIEENSNLSKDVIEDKIKKKMSQLSGLISKEGAAHIIANELGIKLFENISGKLQIKNILAGMRNVETVGKVQQVFEVREFASENRHGKVGSFIVGDETGSIRMVLWNDQVVSMENLKAGDIVKISGGYVRDNNRKIEVHLNDRSNMVINPKGEKIENVKELKSIRKSIKELTEADDDVEIVGTVVQLFDPRFFEICPKCGRRAKPKDSGFACDTHNDVEPIYSYVMNMFVDDGTDNLRVVCFRNQAERAIGKTREEMLKYREAPEKFEDMKKEMMGNLVKFHGRVVKNEMFDRLEFVCNRVFTDINPEEEIKRLSEEVEIVEKNKEEIKAEPVKAEEIADSEVVLEEKEEESKPTENLPSVEEL
ncbi:hypothetical protein HQ533_00005 [Candidatus Woesearchaeota archaeon]|nr:hypothetical protein [Candidatus Woesearchaeota archaeon]